MRTAWTHWGLAVAAAVAAVSTDPPRCPTRASKAAVGLAASVVSRRRDVAARDAIRRTWCETARAVSRDDAVVVVRFFVGRDPDPGGPDDLDRGDVTLVDVVDSPFAVLRLRLHALLRYEDWAPHATHLLALDDDAYPFLDRIVQDLRRDGRLRGTFVWGRFEALGGVGPWPVARGFGRVLTADLAHALALNAAAIPFELQEPCLRLWGTRTNITCDRACPDADPRVPGACLKDTFIREDGFLGLALAPYGYEVVHDERFHALPASPASRVVDLGHPNRLWETHEAATIPACAWGRVRCENNSVGEIERVGYKFTIDYRTIWLVFDDCRSAEAFGDVCVANASDTQGRVSLWERADMMHLVALDDCRALAGDVAAVGRAALPGSCGR